MDKEEIKISTSILSGFSFALVGTTCCTLPILLLTLGMGGAVASLVSTLPWLVTLSRYKAITFTVTMLVLAYGYLRLRNADYCEQAAQRRLKWQRALLWTSTGLFVVSVFMAYALLPLVLWWESSV